MSVKKPSDWLCERYEERRAEFTKQLNKEVEESLMNTEMKKIGQILDTKAKSWTKKMFDLQAVWYKVCEKLGREPKLKELSEETGIDYRLISKRLKSMDKSYPIWRKSPRKSPFSPE
jgi:predicted secreted Zn-dependent protease